MSTLEQAQSNKCSERIAGVPSPPVRNGFFQALSAGAEFPFVSSRWSLFIKRGTLFKLFLLCAAPGVVAGCSLIPFTHRHQTVDVISAPSNPHLSPTMSDESILTELGFDPVRMKAEHNQGRDGSSTSYTTRNGDSVFITRSVATGVFVMQSGPNGNRSWELGKPRATPRHRHRSYRHSS